LANPATKPSFAIVEIAAKGVLYGGFYATKQPYVTDDIADTDDICDKRNSVWANS